MKIAIIAAEIAPWAKAGGLADVIGALPQAMAAAGAQPSVIVPGYSAILSALTTETLKSDVSLDIGTGHERFAIHRGKLPVGVPIYLVVHPAFFARDGVYGDRRGDYVDNIQRYTFFGRAAAHIAAEFVRPDVLHAHDWHGAPATIAIRADSSLQKRMAGVTSVLTIHNLAFQGIFEKKDYGLLGLDSSWFTVDGLEFFGRVNLMKGAILLADAVSTVSPTYAHEIVTDPDLGFGLEGVLRQKGDRFRGILNGADYTNWNPETDTNLPARYSSTRPAGKLICRRALRDALELPHRADAPMVGIIARMTPQKGFDLIHDAMNRIMQLDLQFVMLSSGDAALEKFFKKQEGLHPDKFRLISEFNEPMAHRIQAASDAFLMPSRFEPCGLTQMYALKYGAAPVVRATGGLRDTIAEFNPKSGKGNGFVFERYAPEDLIEALERMTGTYRNASRWQRLVDNTYACDFSWDRAARAYIRWFEELRAKSALA